MEDHEEVTDTRPELRLPAEIVVLSHRYQVTVVEDPKEALGRVSGNDEHSLGMTDLHRGTIRIRGGGEQSEDAVRDTLLHEVLHAVDYHAGGLDATLEESTIAAVATVLLDTLRRNPLLVAALISR